MPRSRSRNLRCYTRNSSTPVAEHHARIVELMGDGALVEFASVVEAVECAAAIQRALAERSTDVPENQRTRIRIGINAGGVIVKGGDLYGDAVNVAARLESIAEPAASASRPRCSRGVPCRPGLGFAELGGQRSRTSRSRLACIRCCSNRI